MTDSEQARTGHDETLPTHATGLFSPSDPGTRNPEAPMMFSLFKVAWTQIRADEVLGQHPRFTR